MKVPFVACSALVAALSATPSNAAEWWWIGNVSEPKKPIEQLLFADAKSLSAAPDWISVRTRQYYYSAPHPNVFYFEVDQQVNCPTKRIRPIFLAAYDRHDRLVGSDAGGIWLDTPTGSLGDQIYRFACENERPNRGPLPANRNLSEAADILMSARRN
ncbi:MAG: hypothetical protein ACJ8FN_07070 [Sphingomicrobium sp.]|jgi:hypothetical protein